MTYYNIYEPVNIGSIVLYDKGLLNGKSNKYLLDVTNLIDESAERRLTQREFENVIDDYLSDLEKRQ